MGVIVGVAVGDGIDTVGTSTGVDCGIDTVGRDTYVAVTSNAPCAIPLLGCVARRVLAAMKSSKHPRLLKGLLHACPSQIPRQPPIPAGGATSKSRTNYRPVPLGRIISP